MDAPVSRAHGCVGETLALHHYKRTLHAVQLIFLGLMDINARGFSKCIYSGFQYFQDTSCSTPKEETNLPDKHISEYKLGGNTTTEDGTNGNLITLDFESNVTVDGIYTITSQNQLCFTSNLSINTADFSFKAGAAGPIDYNNCLTLHSAENNQGQNPQNSNLVGIWKAHTLCNPSDAGGTYQYALEFTKDNKVQGLNIPYATDDCSGEPGNASNATTYTYTDLGETTLPNGTTGHSLQYISSDSSTQGYYTFDNENNLCLSYNLGFSDNNSTDIDYENCLRNINN
jgi:hypothetical protein